MRRNHKIALGIGVSLAIIGGPLYGGKGSSIVVLAGLLTVVVASYLGVASRPAYTDEVPTDPADHAAYDAFERRANLTALAIVAGMVALILVGAQWAVNEALSRGRCPAPIVLTIAMEDTPWYCVGAGQ